MLAPRDEPLPRKGKGRRGCGALSCSDPRRGRYAAGKTVTMPSAAWGRPVSGLMMKQITA